MLFGDHAEGALARAVELVEQTIAALGVDPAESRLPDAEGERRYALRRGSATLVVSLVHPGEASGEGALRVVAPVVRLPDAGRDAQLFRHLLELNASALFGVAFGIDDRDVLVVAERSLRDLDASEVDGMIRAVGREADRYDDVLARDYDTVRSSDGD